MAKKNIQNFGQKLPKKREKSHICAYKRKGTILKSILETPHVKI